MGRICSWPTKTSTLLLSYHYSNIITVLSDIWYSTCMFSQAAIKEGLGVLKRSRFEEGPTERVLVLLDFYISKLLSEADKKALQRLALFRGTFSEDGAAYLIEVGPLTKWFDRPLKIFHKLYFPIC